MIPLHYFLDRTILHKPIGLLTDDGLTSAMRNIMAESSIFDQQIVSDLRCRDNDYSEVFTINDYNPNVRRLMLPGNAWLAVKEDNKGITLRESTGYDLDPARLNISAYYNQNLSRDLGISSGKVASFDVAFPYETSGKTYVSLAAIRRDSFRTGDLPAHGYWGCGFLGLSGYDLYAGIFPDWYRDVSGENKTTLRCFVFGGTYEPANAVFSNSIDVWNSDSLGKWMLIQVCHWPEGGNYKVKFRVLNAQFNDGSNGPLESSTFTISRSVLESYYLGHQNIASPLNQGLYTGFAQHAIMANNSTVGTNISDLEWNLFDEEHICSSYNISGNKINFSCSGNVAWDILVNGVWVNSNGEDVNTRVWNTGTSSISTLNFTAIRPVLQNTGLMNADTNAVLNWVNVTSDIPNPNVFNNISTNNVVFCYRENDSDSLELANYYATARNIPVANLISLSVDNVSILDNKNDYISQIEEPLLSKIYQRPYDTYVIIFGLNVPLGFIDTDGEVIAVASRISRIGKSNYHKYPNHTYDRKLFKYYDSDDSSEEIITAVINASDLSIAKKLIDRALVISKQNVINGNIFLDPYGLKLTSEELDYQKDILYFKDGLGDSIGLEVISTVDVDDPYSEPITLSLYQDSFYWGWFTPKVSKEILTDSNFKRVFLYNADYDGAESIQESLSESSSWCNVAISSDIGYASCAGSVSNSDVESFLRPYPFFYALMNGATLGEAFLFASPYTNWKTILIGDPLITVKFSSSIVPTESSVISNKEAIIQIKNSIETSLGWAYRQSRLLDDIVKKNYISTNMLAVNSMLNNITNWKNDKNIISQEKLYVNMVGKFINYIKLTTGLTLSEWLTDNNTMISSKLNEVVSLVSNPIDSSLVYPAGHWEYRILYNHPYLTFERIHFVLEIYKDENYLNLINSFSTLSDVSNWEYELESSKYYDFQDTGFPSNLSGRRVRFITKHNQYYLTTTELYYIRWKAIRDSGENIYPSSGWQNDYIVISR